MTAATFVRAYVVTMRPYLLFVSGITGIAALALAPDIPAAATLALAAVCFLSYGFGQALTDCFQTDTDALSAPYRPLVQGRIGRAEVLAVSLLGLVASGIVVTSYAPANLALAALAVLGLATYTPMKRRWWAGPLYNAWIVAVLFLIAHLAALGAAGAPLAWSPRLGGALAAVLLGYANFVLVGYYKDLSADRATGYRTMPVAFGFKASSVVSHLLSAAQLGACGLVAWASRPGPGLWLLGAGAAAAVVAQARLHRVRHEAEAYRAITPLVHGYVLLLAGLAALAKPGWTPALALFYAAFVVALGRRPMREQI